MYSSSSAYHADSYNRGGSYYDYAHELSPARSASMSQFSAVPSTGYARSASHYEVAASVGRIGRSPYISRPNVTTYADARSDAYASYRTPYVTNRSRADYSSTLYQKPPVHPSAARYRTSIYDRTPSSTYQSSSSGYSSQSSSANSSLARPAPMSRSASVDRYGLGGLNGGNAAALEDAQRRRYDRQTNSRLAALNADMDLDGGRGSPERYGRLTTSTYEPASSYRSSVRRQLPATPVTNGTSPGYDAPTLIASPSDSEDLSDNYKSLRIKTVNESYNRPSTFKDELCPPPSPSHSGSSNGRKSPNNKRVHFNDPKTPVPQQMSPNRKGGQLTGILRSPSPTVSNYSNNNNTEAASSVQVPTPPPPPPVANPGLVSSGTAPLIVNRTKSHVDQIKDRESYKEKERISKDKETSLPNGIVNGTGTGTGLIGLVNIGNTCFMNSVLQCLSHTRPLREYCLVKHSSSACNTTTSRMKGALMKAFCDLLQELWGSPRSSITPDQFKSQIQKFSPRFVGYSQQDAQEFLRYLMQGLHEDVNRVSGKPKPDHSEIDSSLPETKQASMSWNRYLRIDNSPIVDIFVGQLKSELKCMTCEHVSCTFDPFWDLSLPIPSSGDRFGSSRGVTLQDCFQALTGEETLDGDEQPTCERCKTRRKCTKRFYIYKMPSILVLHLKRFSGERYRSRLSTLVQFPLKGLDLSRYCAEASSRCTYNLYGVSNHTGTPMMGHYTGYVRHAINTDKWYHFDDSRVSPIKDPERTVPSSDAYVLFYEMQGEVSRL